MRLALVTSMLVSGSVVAQAPWLPIKEQARVKIMMPEGVPISDRLKFYKLPQKFQELVVSNGAPTNTILPVITQEHPWVVSGGMNWVNRNEWYNVTGLDLPEGSEIDYWVQRMDAGAPLPVPKLRWRFPQGTLAYDVLVKRGSIKDHIFEVRIQEKGRLKWDAGATYRPEVIDKKLNQRTYPAWYAFETRNESNFTITARIDTNLKWSSVDEIDVASKFIMTKDVVVDNGNFTPTNYYGTGTRCGSCHELVGMRTGYGTVVRGDDGRFSWHPFDSNNYIDTRWPLKWLGSY